MGGDCPELSPDSPLVHGLLGVVDCNVQELVRSGYDALFQPSAAFGGVLTAVLTIYVAVIGYQLLLGRSQLNITDFALTAVKLGVVLALATQWGAYQTVVYHLLFYGPQQIADVILHNFSARGSSFGGDVFDGLQRAFTDLTSFSPATPPGGQVQAAVPIGGGGTPLNPSPSGGTGVLSNLLSKSGFDALLMLNAAVVLMLSSLGVLLASKIVLGLLLATGPIFIAMLLFDSTRGIFEGWLRACLAFAFAPIAVTLMLGIALTMLEPLLEQVETMRESNTYLPGVAFGIMVLVMVFATVAVGMVAAGGLIAAGFKLPGRRRSVTQVIGGTAETRLVQTDHGAPTRAGRTAVAVAAQGRRDAALVSLGAPSPVGAPDLAERRLSISPSVAQAVREPALETRLGQTGRRTSPPRVARSGARSA